MVADHSVGPGGAKPRAEPAQIVANIADPELPHLTIGDLGIVRDVETSGRTVRVKLTPTYLGCPATEQIRDDVTRALESAGFDPIVEFVLAPAWSTTQITAIGRAKLEAVGIAPPPRQGHEQPILDSVVDLEIPVRCPLCGSSKTRRLSDFGSTACKSPMVCKSCKEPFEQFKPL